MIGTLLGVLAIFGGIPAISGILAGTSASNKRYRQDSQRHEAERQAFVRRVTNPELEKELEAFTRDPANQDVVREETREFWEWLCAKNYKPKDLFPPRSRYAKDEELQPPDWFCAARIMLARRGYLPKRLADAGSYMHMRCTEKYGALILEWCANYLKEHDYVPEQLCIQYEVKRNGKFCGYSYRPFSAFLMDCNGLPFDQYCGWII